MRGASINQTITYSSPPRFDREENQNAQSRDQCNSFPLSVSLRCFHGYTGWVLPVRLNLHKAVKWNVYLTARKWLCQKDLNQGKQLKLSAVYIGRLHKGRLVTFTLQDQHKVFWKYCSDGKKRRRSGQTSHPRYHCVTQFWWLVISCWRLTNICL